MYARVGDYIRSHEFDSYGQIAARLGLSRNQVVRIAKKLGIRRVVGRSVAALEAAVNTIEALDYNSHCASTLDAATLPAEEPIHIERDAQLADEAQSITPATLSAKAAGL